MHLLEEQSKQLCRDAGIVVPQGATARTADEAASAAAAMGRPVVVKAQIPAGKRGRSGGIVFASGAAEARAAAARLLGRAIHGFDVGTVRVEEAVDFVRETYVAVLNDPASKGPLILFSSEGGVDIEEVSAASPEKVFHVEVDIRRGPDPAVVQRMLERAGLQTPERDAVAAVIARVYQLYRDVDADLVEINPLALTPDGRATALDAKVTLDPAATARHDALWQRVRAEAPTSGTERERAAEAAGLRLIELDGSVGVLANGAGLTMATLDAVNHYGGRPANFLEIGGDAYTMATPALRLVLANPNVRSLLVNFCGAFARTDVMTEGVVKALEELRPDIPVFFSIHGTGEADAIRMVRQRLGAEPYELMDDAVQAAVAAANLPTAVV